MPFIPPVNISQGRNFKAFFSRFVQWDQNSKKTVQTQKSDGNRPFIQTIMRLLLHFGKSVPSQITKSNPSLALLSPALFIFHY